jgi:hypothetical protein
VGPCHRGMAPPRIANGEDGLQIWRIAANIANKSSWIAEKWWFSSWGGGTRG